MNLPERRSHSSKLLQDANLIFSAFLKATRNFTSGDNLRDSDVVSHVQTKLATSPKHSLFKLFRAGFGFQLVRPIEFRTRSPKPCALNPAPYTQNPKPASKDSWDLKPSAHPESATAGTPPCANPSGSAGACLQEGFGPLNPKP